MLIDKGYYDYDYTTPKPKPKDVKLRSDEEMQSIARRMGFGTMIGKKSEQMDAETLQSIAMKKER